MASYYAFPALAPLSACPALAPLSAYSSGPTSTPWAWPTVTTPDPPPAHPPRHFSVFVCGVPGICSLRGEGCVTVLLVCLTGHQISMYVEHMACCLLLLPCALLTIVCPPPILLPSHCIVSVAPPVSPSLPSFVSLFTFYCIVHAAYY